MIENSRKREGELMRGISLSTRPRLTPTMRRMRMRGGMMATETPLIPTKQMKPARPLPMWRLTCDSVIGRVASRWMRWMNRRSRSTTEIGIALLW